MDSALLIHGLRQLIRTWRAQAVAAPPSEAAVYRRVETELSDCVAGVCESRQLWDTVKADLVGAILEHLDQTVRVEGR